MEHDPQWALRPVAAGSVYSSQHVSLCRFLLNLHALHASLLFEGSGCSVHGSVLVPPVVVVVVVVVVVEMKEEGQNVGQRSVSWQPEVGGDEWSERRASVPNYG